MRAIGATVFRQSTLFTAGVCLLLCPVPTWGQSWQFPLGEETTPDQFDLVFALNAPSPWPAKARLQVALSMRDEGNFYYADFAGGKVSLGSCTGGKRQALSQAAALSKAVGQSEVALHEIAIQRRARLLQVVCDGLRVATAYDARLSGGRVAVAASEGLEVDEVTAQPIGDVYLFDDFTREPDESGAWDVLLGQWQSSGESIERPKPNLSANPFSYHVSADGKALAATSHDFWSDYRLRAAVKPAAEGAVGLALYMTNPSNYYLLRWSRAGAEPQAGGRLQLVKVQAGSWSVLAEEIDLPYSIDQWHDLAIAAADGCLEAYVDGRLALSAHDTTFVRGRPALFAEDCASAYFDDVSVRTYDRFAEDFSSPDVIGGHASEGRCCPLRGDWKIHHEHLYGAARAPTAHAYMLTGERAWSNYILDVMVKPKESKRVGLVFCYRRPSDHYLLRWGPGESAQGLRELVRLADGEEHVLATAHFAHDPSRFDKMRVVTHRGHLTVTVNGQLALEATDASFSHGQIGFYVEGDREACFDNVTVRFPEAPSPPPSITAQFTNEDTMRTWASPEASWVKVSGGAFRYGLPLFGDLRIDVRLRKLDREKGQLHLFLGSDEQLNGGARLTASCEGGLLKAQLFSGDAELTSGEARSASSAPVLVVERHGDAVLASLADPVAESVLLAHQVPAAAEDNYVGFKRAGLSPAAGQIDVCSHGILDHAFSGAPTGWQPGAGIWEIYDRWPCARGWSWFGGRDQDTDPKNPILWCKDTWAGELVLQFWGAVIMDLDHEPGYSDPSDINCTICADGQNLCSGYSFIYAGDHNKKAKILRRDQVVAETDKGVFINPISPNAEFHRHWFETRIHKVGGHIEYHMDNQLLLQYDDPNPLPDGHIALWGYNNGLLVSRVKMSAEQRLPGGG